jgi:3-dehydroquinate synthase II
MSSDRIVVHPISPDEQIRAATVAQAFRRGFRRFVAGPLEHLPEGSERIGATAEAYHLEDRRTVLRREVATPEELARAIRDGAAHGSVALRWTGDRVIPLENTLSENRTRLEVWVTTSRVSEVPSILGALEHGAAAVVVEMPHPDDVEQLEALLDARPHATLDWIVGKVVRVVPAGLSDRVLLDTTSLLGESEGFAIGSRASVLFHIRSEALGSAHSRPRRFRVNGGAPHSYVLMADGSTRYLSELESGEELLSVDASGRSRGVRVGRLKIERRPMVLIEATFGPERASIFLQEAETVRLSTNSGAVAATAIAPGGSVLLAILPRARHLGRVVEETIEER